MFYKHNLFVSSLFQGRRCFKKVTVAGTVTLHHRYIYRGYLQIACVATVTRRSARSPLPATSRNPSNGHRNTTTRKPHWSTTTTVTTRPPWAGGFPATPSRNKAEGTSTPSSGIILGAAWTFSGSGVFGNASKDALVLNHRQTILRNIRWRWGSHILEQSVSVSGTDICRSA